MKGIILAGGYGTRLYPLTKAVSKQLLPVYNKPMIHYPLSTLMVAGVREIFIITTPEDEPLVKKLLGDGSDFGIHVSYGIQERPAGIPEAFLIAERFIADSDVCLLLGDNIFYGNHLGPLLQEAIHDNLGATIFGYHVRDPRRYGIVEFDERGNVLSIEEKPDQPKSNYAVTGLYVYDNSVVQIAKKLNPGRRGELEITDVNAEYLRQGKLKVEVMGRGYTWFDGGTYASLNDASNFIRMMEDRQGFQIGCLEEIAFRAGYLSRAEILHRLGNRVDENARYVRAVLEEVADVQ